MSTLSVVITPPNNFIMNGKHVTFKAPCDSEGVTGAYINEDPVVYTFMDSRGREMAEFNDVKFFKEGAMVHIVLDVDNHLAYVQNTNFESAAAVKSFNGRHGEVMPKGDCEDYNYEMVGAAAEKHADEHISNPEYGEIGADPITPEMIGAATSDHNHDNRYADINHTHDIDMSHAHDDRYALIDHEHNYDDKYAPKEKTVFLSGEINISLEDNTQYILTDVTSLKFADNKHFAYGTIKFAPTNVTAPREADFDSFVGQAGDNIVDALAGEVWEFNTYKGYMIWKNWSAD